jgi:hypothetical protein
MKSVYVFIFSDFLLQKQEFSQKSRYVGLNMKLVFRIARAGIFLRSSLLGAGSWGSGNLEGVGQLGEGWGK